VRWPSGEDLVELLEERRDLARRDVGVRGIDELGREAQHPQQRQRAEDDEPVAVEVVEEAEHFLPLALENRVVQRPMRGAELDPHLLLLLGRQVGGDELLRAAQHQRADPSPQSREPRRTMVAALVVVWDLSLLDGSDVLIAEPSSGREQPGCREGQQRPELGQAVLHRRAGDREGHVGTQIAGGTVRLRLAVLHELGLVEHQSRPLDARELRLVEAEERVRRDHQISGCRGIPHRYPPLRARRIHDRRFQTRREPRGLRSPGGQHGRRCDDEERPRLAGLPRVRDERQHLDRLAETHVVREDAAEPVLPEEREPVEAGALVGAQLRKEPRRRWRGGNPVEVAAAPPPCAASSRRARTDRRRLRSRPRVPSGSG
jgi:hypothetical protein